ncbi:uncharacterized protein CLUP02_17645 [Colletotrichum lupini]|uniref:Uncharacterized protein n=1 Tax=Colletotrichum lupini TaxID=145971 RepID=A0A9Q8WAG3_9PEZI|nr:uncharacterized protein CLUP02_17645 [Colletotrichum lupini]UQC76134.1 hypothetical protein CLUP02_17645 [Colletotrichum lupini]
MVYNEYVMIMSIASRQTPQSRATLQESFSMGRTGAGEEKARGLECVCVCVSDTGVRGMDVATMDGGTCWMNHRWHRAPGVQTLLLLMIVRVEPCCCKDFVCAL